MENWTKQVLDSWNLQLKASYKLLDSLTDEQLMKEISPGKNTGVYLLGHLVTVHDGMLPLLDSGSKIYPELEHIFLRNPDKSGFAFPEISVLRQNWKDINEQLNGIFAQYDTSDWFKRHTAVSEEAFVKEPHRNKLNILLSRTSHLAYHLGQMALLKT